MPFDPVNVREGSTRELTFAGLGTVFVSISDMTEQSLADEFASHITDLSSLYSQSVTPTVSGAVVNLALTRLASLIEIVQNGRVNTSSPQGPRNLYATKEMASQLELVILTMQSAGLNINDFSGSTAQIQAFGRWQDMAEAGRILNSLALAGKNVSIQSLIETDYVDQGNRLIATEMADLREALGDTKEALEILADIQNAHNLITPAQLDDLNNSGRRITYDNRSGDTRSILVRDVLGRTSWSDESFLNAWEALVDVHFDPVPVAALPSGGALTIEADRLRLEVVPRLDDLITSLELRRGASALVDGTLESELREVRAGLSGVLSGPDLANWIIDNINTPDGAGRGDIQNGISGAITSASNLNDQQKEDLRRILFIFEEFYKSASAIMSKINQLIEKIAGNISR